MMIFWTFVAGLTVLALAFALIPLWWTPRVVGPLHSSALNVDLVKQQLAELESDLASGLLDSTQYAEARRDLERELLLDAKPVFVSDLRAGRWMATFVTLLVVPLLAVGFYQKVGDTSLAARLGSAQNADTQPSSATAPGETVPTAMMVQRLADRLQNDPNNVGGWLVLGRSYLAVGDASKGLAALEKAYALAPQNILVALTYAEALAQTNDGNLSGRPAKIIESVFEIHPNDPNALWMRGMLAFQQNRFAEAVRLWTILRGLSPNNDKDMATLDELIEAASARIPTGTLVPDPLAPSAPSASHTAFLRLRVTLANHLKDQVTPQDSLFIFARSPAGPSVPIVAYRARAADLPLELELNDSMAMMPSMRLSQFSQVVVGARISKTGDAVPKQGDLQGETGPVTPLQTVDSAMLASPITVVIDQIHP